MNETYIHTVNVQQAIDAVVLARFLDEHVAKREKRRCLCRQGSPDSCEVCHDENGVPVEDWE